jgi:glucose uptake protein GlcU
LLLACTLLIPLIFVVVVVVVVSYQRGENKKRNKAEWVSRVILTKPQQSLVYCRQTMFYAVIFYMWDIKTTTTAISYKKNNKKQQQNLCQTHSID